MIQNRQGTPSSAFNQFDQPQPGPGRSYNDTSRDFSSPAAGFGGGWGMPMGGATNDFGGSAGMTPSRIQGPPGGVQYYAGGGPVPGYAGGGAIDETTGDVGMGPMGGGFASQLAAAVKACQEALAEGRRRYGVGQEEQQEASMKPRTPMRPGNPSDSGFEREQPMPGPLPPTQNPFGKRAEVEDEPKQEEAIPTEDEEIA